MFIKKVYIENFGNISEKSFILDKGINQFIYENGWGKSTLAVFIKAMLYGLEEKGKRKGAKHRRMTMAFWLCVWECPLVQPSASPSGIIPVSASLWVC